MLINEFEYSDSTEDLVCSYFGGCSYTVEAPSIATMLYNSSTNYIEACGQKCEIDIDLSDETKAVCTLPEIRTRYSVNNFGIAVD